MNEEEKKVIKMLDKFTTEHKFYNIKHSDNLEDNIEIVLKLIEKLQKENEELKEKENKIYKEVQKSLAFEKLLIVKERKPDLFNQGRFYISQIIYDILNDVQNPEGIHKENKCIQYIDYIPVQIVKDKIKELNSRIEIYRKYVEQGVETDVEWVDNVADRETVKVLQELIKEEEEN